jgi:UDP-glucose 4-epimerase
MKKVLITGAAGMIGSHLSDELLRKGYKVVGMDNLAVGRIENVEHNLKDRNFKFIRVDILDIDAVKSAAKNMDIIVHLAASKKIGEDRSAFKTLTVNAEGTRNVFEAAKKRRIKVIFASTSDVYGNSNDLPFKEDGKLVIGSPTAKRWAYAASKIYCEQLAFAYYKEFKVPIVILRYFGGFSPRASFSWSGGHVPVFIKAVLNNRPVMIHGSGKQTRSMAYVDDLIAGTVLAMESSRAVGEIFNIGNDEETAVIETARLIKEISGRTKVPVKFIPFKKVFGDYAEIMRRVPDLSKAKKILGYQPTISLREGIKRTIEHYLIRKK